MNKAVIFLLFIGLLFTNCSKKIVPAEIDSVVSTSQNQEFRKSAPLPGAARKLKIGKATTFDLDNGLKVIVVENHKLPRVSYSLTLRHEAIQEGEKAGYASFAGQLMSRGTKTKSKAEIDEAIDFMGANLGTSAFGVFGSSLTKHQNELLQIFTDVLYNPSFPADEFEKIKKQTLSGLATSKTDPNSMAANVASALNFGKDHPFGEIQTEETINNIEISDCQTYYQDFFAPNNAYLTIVGDITPEEARRICSQHFSKWTRKPVKNLRYNGKEAPSKRRVAFVNKDGAVQSVIRVTYPVDLKPGTEDVIATNVMNGILGGGVFSGRLMQNLREDKAYTYGARSSISSNSIVGNFNASASVRNEVTDSSITEFLYELDKMRSTLVSEQELEMTKSYMTGSFARSLESPQTVARFALNTIRYNLPEDYYETYLERLDAINTYDVERVAQKYIRPENAYIVVVGNKDEVAEKLIPFDADGEIEFYDYKGDEIKKNESSLPAGLTAEIVIEDYLAAIGGKDKLNGIKSLKTTMGMEMMGQKMVIEMAQKQPSMMSMKVGNGQMVFQEQKFDGTKGLTSQMGQSKVVTEGPEFESMRQQTVLFEQLTYSNGRYQLELKEIEEIEGQNCYKISITEPNGDVKTQYYSVSNSLLVREVQNQNGPGGQSVTVINDMLDYKAVDGVLFPHTLKVSGMMPVPAEMKVEMLEVNPVLSDDLFKVEN